MSFEAKEKSVDKLLNDAIYCIPRNQRRYVWDHQNWEDLFDDVQLVVEGFSQSHFIGSIVLKDEGKEDGLQKYTVIDGQQRILTLTIFLSAIMFHLKKRKMMDDFRGTQKYLLARDIKYNNKEIVYPEFHLTLPKIVNTLIDSSEEELSSVSIPAFCRQCLVSPSKDKQIVDAFSFFAEKLQKMSCDELLHTRDALIGIGYVNIISSTEEDSYTIFEILNARGLELEDQELLKNYIMRYLQPAERRDDAKQIWEEIESTLAKNINNFFRHYAVHRFNYNSDKKPSNSVYKAFQNATKGRNVDKLLDDIKLKSDYYASFHTQEGCLPKEKKIFAFLKSKRCSVFYPVLLSLKHQLALEKISEAKYLETLEFIYSFYVCYKVIGQETSNKLSNSVNKYAYILETDYSEKNLNEFMTSLRGKLPTLEAFTNSFKTMGFSNHWTFYSDNHSKERVQLVLILLEEYISNREVNISTTIEHILPDSESVKNAQVGNLILLEETLNHRCDNKPLQEKLKIYNESGLMCPRGIVSRYESKPFDPDKRTVFLARFLYNNILGLSDDSENN